MNRYFYHCFPRRKTDNEAQDIEKGIKILESIMDDGLVLTPEIIEIKEPLSDGTFSEPWTNIQKRCCFTELSEEELPSHQASFGQFALEFEIPTLRYLGAIPTFYIPTGKTTDIGLEHLANSLLCRIGEIQNILNRFAELDQLVKQTNNENKVLDVAMNGKPIGSTRCTMGGAEDLINFLTYGGQPIEIQRNALRAISQFFYPTENLEYTGELDYYRQREWKIIGNMQQLGKELTSKLESSTINRLLDIDKGFFSKELEFRTGKSKIYEQCLLFKEYNNKRIIEYVNRIYVPNIVKDQVEKLLLEIPNQPKIIGI